MAFAENLKALRTEHGYTQKELADMVNITQPVITDYEKGRKQPLISTAVDIAKVLGTTCEELVNGEKGNLKP